MQKAQLVLLDEPMAGMSKTEKAMMSELIQRVQREFGMTFLIVEHDIDRVLGFSQRVTVMNQGEVLMCGTPEEVREDHRVQEIYTGTGTPPVMITPQANGWRFTASLVSRIKGHAAYTEADGQDLGVIGAEEQGADPETTQPDLKLVRVAGGHIEVQWKKSGFTGVRIEVDRGNGQWTFLAVDTVPHYTDTATPAPGTTALWKYRAIYLDGDESFGQWSDTVSIAVNN